MASDLELQMIAQYEMAASTSKNVAGMAGFKDNFLSRIPESHLKLIERYAKIKGDECKRIIESLEADIEKSGLRIPSLSEKPKP